MLRISSLSFFSSKRPLVDHPPVMIQPLVRAIVRSPRWYAMQKFITQTIQNNEQEQKDSSSKKRSSSKKNNNLSKAKKSKKMEKMEESSSALMISTTSSSKQENTALALIKNNPGNYFNVLDCTLGGGNHTEAILEAGEPFTRVAAIDCDGFGVERRAEKITKQYGKSRFRFFPSYRFSQIETLFGPRSFDAVILDPGPNFSQLDDPSRGFCLDNTEDFSSLDMRYSLKFKSSALDILNRAEESELWHCGAQIALLPNKMARHISRSIVKGRPFKDMNSALDAIQMSRFAVGEFMEDGSSWFVMSEKKFVRVAPVIRFFYGLRAFVNQEPQELYEGLRAASEVLEVEGRLIVFSRLPFEQAIIREFAENAPYMLISFEVPIAHEEAKEFTQPLETRMHVLQKTQKPCYEIKNLKLLKGEENIFAEERKSRTLKKEDEMRKMLALDALGTRRGFPARRFGSESSIPFQKEIRQHERNINPSPLGMPGRDDRSKLPKY